MRYLIYRPKSSMIAAIAIMTGIAAAVVVLLIYTSPSSATHTCTGTNIVDIDPGDDLDAIVDADPETTPTTFCVHSGTYTIDRIVTLNSGDQLQGQPGKRTSVGPATKPEPSVQVSPGTNNVSRLIEAKGSNVRIVWLDLSGATGQYLNGQPVAGTGSGISAGNADGTFRARYLRVHNNDAVGIANTKGRVLDSEFFSNTEDPNFGGFTGSAIKGITEFEAARNFVHDENANGIWLDLGRNDPLRTKGYWVHHNLVVDNKPRAGIRYENSPPGLAPGVHTSDVTALIENNQVYGNSALAPDPRPISVRNSQNAVIRNNIFGTATINGVTYRHNGDNVAIRADDNARSDRTDLWNVDIIGNKLNGERIVLSMRDGQVLACGDLSPAVVSCANNSP
jgi:hypothetical protein